MTPPKPTGGQNRAALSIVVGGGMVHAMIPLDDAATTPEAGAKARMLARARAAGLPALDGVVILPSESIDTTEFSLQLSAALKRLGGERFAVRSSADLEDRPGMSAAGIFVSVIGVSSSEIPAAVERVRASARSDAARDYLAAYGYGVARMAVLVQPLVEAERLGVLHTAPVRGGALAAEERSPSEPEWGAVVPRDVPLDDPLAVGAHRLADLVGGPADIEYARTATAIVFLQARPLSARNVGAIDLNWDPSDDAIWIQDAEHNPAPLSMAQQSLVRLVEDLPGCSPQRVLHGYLYYCPERAAPPLRLIPPADIPRSYDEEIAPACNALLATIEQCAEEDQRLRAALSAYRAVLGHYLGTIAPSLKRVRTLLDQFLRANVGEPLASHGALLAGTGERTTDRDRALWRIGRATGADREVLLAGYNACFGAYAPAWDVIAATDDESAERVIAAATLVARGADPAEHHAAAVVAAVEAERALLVRLDRMARGAFKSLLAVVRAALTIAEADDVLFFRAQRSVRRALQAMGRSLVARDRLDEPEQVFEVPIAALLDGQVDRVLAERNRRDRLDQSRRSPPSEIRDRLPTWRGGGSSTVLRGSGTAGRAVGRAWILIDPEAPPTALPPGAILVTKTILPSLAYLLPSAAALITDFGGALSHGATLAREYGIPAVLGTGSATALLTDGEELLVDADGGRIYRNPLRAG